MEFSRSAQLATRLRTLVPGGCHTYAKGADQYPQRSPGVLTHGRGSHVWDADGNEFIEYGMGLRSVGLGHAHPVVTRAVQEALDLGTNFTRPSMAELECAERFCGLIPNAEMVKFTKDGSTATSAALKLARRATGREMVAICAEHPFFSYDDWFIATTTLDGGIPPTEIERVARFGYNDLASVQSLFTTFPERIAAVFLEPARTEPPASGFLEGLRALCTEHGTVLVFDEMITGFRYAFPGVQQIYGVVPDLSTFGKALANGFAVSALCGKRELMSLGSGDRDEDNVFLLSTTHGAETVGLAAAIATMDVYESEPVIEHFYRQGQRLIDGFTEAAAGRGLADYVAPVGFPCNLVFSTLDPEGEPSQAFRTLFLQELTERGVLAPSLVVSYAHSDADIEKTVEAIDGALAVYEKAFDDGAERHLVGRPSRHVFERRWA